MSQVTQQVMWRTPLLTDTTSHVTPPLPYITRFLTDTSHVIILYRLLQ